MTTLIIRRVIRDVQQPPQQTADDVGDSEEQIITELNKQLMAEDYCRC